jgi:protein-S-isoprenylcysteine O-methyltransferase Ste14
MRPSCFLLATSGMSDSVITFPAYVNLLLLAALLAAAFYVFARVRADYRTCGRLTRPVAILQVTYFCVYALCSYIFLDSRLSHIRTDGALFALALILMAIGFLLVLISMPFLGRRSFGYEVGGLRTSGLYRFSRNPQLVGGFFFIIGYVMLWPSWQGAVWASLWLPIMHLMVRGEEEHLEHVFGSQYRDYCTRTPRYLGIPSKNQSKGNEPSR